MKIKGAKLRLRDEGGIIYHKIEVILHRNRRLYIRILHDTIMNKSLSIILITFLFTACKTKKRNLNHSIGWESANPDDYTILIVKWNQISSDSSLLAYKSKFEEAVLKELKSNQLGEQAENDDQKTSDLILVVQKNYKKALETIITVSKSYNVEQKITVYQRDYNSYDKWEDRVVYP